MGKKGEEMVDGGGGVFIINYTTSTMMEPLVHHSERDTGSSPLKRHWISHNSRLACFLII